MPGRFGQKKKKKKKNKPKQKTASGLKHTPQQLCRGLFNLSTGGQAGHLVSRPWTPPEHPEYASAATSFRAISGTLARSPGCAFGTLRMRRIKQ